MSKPKTYHARICPTCKTSFVTTRSLQMCCSYPCAQAYRSEGGVRLITRAQVRAEDGLDRPKSAHVCRYYPPAMKCLCGKRLPLMTAASD